MMSICLSCMQSTGVREGDEINTSSTSWFGFFEVHVKNCVRSLEDNDLQFLFYILLMVKSYVFILIFLSCNNIFIIFYICIVSYIFQ